MTLDKKLARLRKREGLSQAEVSEALDVSRQAVTKWETGTSRPSIENLQSLSRLYNVPLEYLLDDSKDLSFSGMTSAEVVEESKSNIKEKRKKVLVLIIIGALVLACCIALIAALFDGNQKTLDLEEIPGEVMPATGSDFNFSL